MKNSFKAGDKVRRINSTFNNAIEGCVYTVASRSNSANLYLEECGSTSFDPKNFEKMYSICIVCGGILTTIVTDTGCKLTPMLDIPNIGDGIVCIECLRDIIQ